MKIDLTTIERAQRAVCLDHDANYLPSPSELVCGFAVVTKGQLPVNGLRHPPTNETTGWYIWCGAQFSEARDFFDSVHTYHLYEDEPAIALYLGLPAGYRFLLAGDYVDVWFDASLLNL